MPFDFHLHPGCLPEANSQQPEAAVFFQIPPQITYQSRYLNEVIPQLVFVI
jgi:hypothetical protein